MGDVIHADFSRLRKALIGFIPDEIGQDEPKDLVEFAKDGQPPIADHSFTPDDCA